MELGARGETHACGYLVEKGYKIIERNYRERWGELDIVARAPDRTLVFVEVKTMQNRGVSELLPEDQMSRAKLVKFSRIAEQYANDNPHLINERMGWRLDVLAIKEEKSVFQVRHYINVSHVS